MEIQTRQDKKRRCGWRKPGGLYMVSGGIAQSCGKLPLPLTVCPVCSCGIKPSRGWTWIDGTALVKDVKCRYGEIYDAKIKHPCTTCPMHGEPGRVGLLWIGEKFYPMPGDFAKEAAQQGVSRRIKSIPREFVLGETWVWFAHRKGITEFCDHPDIELAYADQYIYECKYCDKQGRKYTPAVVYAFKPTAIEYVVKGDETDEQLEAMAKRGITPIKIEKIGETKQMI